MVKSMKNSVSGVVYSERSDNGGRMDEVVCGCRRNGAKLQIPSSKRGKREELAAEVSAEGRTAGKMPAAL